MADWGGFLVDDVLALCLMFCYVSVSHHWVWKCLKVKGSEMGMGIRAPQSYWAYKTCNR
jgi:hypothetical protein